jgi:sulfatase modifying factor 1
MYGNVKEWCSDRHGNYPRVAVADPTGPSRGSNRVVRGGSWGGIAGFCQSVNRRDYAPDSRNSFLGFRVVMIPSIAGGAR